MDAALKSVTAGSLASKSDKRRLLRGGAGPQDADAELESAPAITKKDDLALAFYLTYKRNLVDLARSRYIDAGA